MSDTIIVILDQNKSFKGFIKKDNKVVDILDKECIMDYLTAAEFEKKLAYNIQRKLISLKDLLAINPSKSTELINILVNNHG